MLPSCAAWTDSRTPSRALSMDATRPKKMRSVQQWAIFASASHSGMPSGISGIGLTATASTRKACEERSSIVRSASDFAPAPKCSMEPLLPTQAEQASMTKLGAPLTHAMAFSPGDIICTPPKPRKDPSMETPQIVSIIFLLEENGTSIILGYCCCNSSERIPIFSPATTNGTSEELPLGAHRTAPLSSFSCSTRALLQRTATSKVDRTDGSHPSGASLPSARITVPLVGSKPTPEIL
mmetsp:Transcript_119673/g.300855  ORF Transcript_119673/g.300855 Transcript_119673/m.300855 type:complete len:238 (+) Transcript_119673:266-979(+)